MMPLPALLRVPLPTLALITSLVTHSFTATALADTSLASETSTGSKPPLSIGVSVSDLGNPYFVRIAQGAEQEARQLAGDSVTFQLVSSAYDIERQIQQVDQFIASAVDLIVLVAASYDGIASSIRKAQNAGIRVLAVDVRARGADITVTTNNHQAGQVACEFLAQQLGWHGNLVIVNGPPVSSILARVQGCLDVLSDYPDITVLSSDRNAGGSRLGGLEVMTHLMTEFPEIDGVFAINDPSAIGAEQAARMANRRFIMTSVDAAPAALQQLQESDTRLVGTAAQLPAKMASIAIRLGYQLLQGNHVSQRQVQIPSYIIHRDNLPDSHTWQPTGHIDTL